MEENESIVDSHIHILPPRRTRGLVRWIKKIFPEHPATEDVTPDEVLGQLRDCGVGTFFNLVFPLKEEETEDLNVWSREIAASSPDITGFGSLHIETPRKDEVTERCMVDLGLAGMKLHPYVQLFEAFSPEFEPMFRRLAELGRPFVVHTGFDVFYRQTQDFDYLRGILERYPAMPVVLVHSLFPRFELARELMDDYPQLYLDMTNAVSAVRWYSESPENWVDAMEGKDLALNIEYFRPLIEENSGRIMFGTDHPVGMGSPEQIYDDLAWFEFPPEVRADLLGSTARSFLEAHCRPIT
jgi:uncharacterized protein